MFSQELVDIKQEPPDEVDEDLASILNSEIHLTEVSHEHNGVASLNESQVIDLLSDENGTVSDKNADGKIVKANLRCKFSYCTFRAKKISELERHEEKHNIPGSYYECKYCKFVTPLQQRLQEHEAKHTNTKPFKCRKCSYRSRYKADVYHHSAKHLKEKKFKCPNKECSFITKWRKNIYHHLLTHTENRPHECNICDYKFKRLQDLKYHLYRHTDEKPIACNQCEFRCKTNYELGCHKLKHSSVRKYACTFPDCHMRTKTKSDLTKHMKTHSKNRDYLCPVCGKAFYMRNSLTKHMECHQDTRNYKCGLCTKSFKTKCTLRAHMQVHNGVKPWTCDICSRDFLNKWNMIKHKETHSGNRPFKCPICPYGAKVGEHLLAHIGTMHGNSFAYFCEICNKPWKRFSQLQVHMKRMHRGALRSNFGSSMKMDIKLEPGTDGDIDTGCDIISVKKIDPTNKDQFKKKRGRPPKIKKEPVDFDDVAMAENAAQGCADPVADVVESLAAEQKEPISDTTLPVQIKQEVQSETGSAKIVCFGDFRLPLATKGFPFNYDKNGKKPKSWFMNPENMHGKAADKQQAYLEKKERDFERYYGRKLGWRRLRLRKKPKPGASYKSVLNKEHDDIKCSLTKMEGKVENNDSGIQKNHENRKQIIKKQDPMELLIKGRKKLILMRKIKRRQKRWKQRMAEIMPSDDDFTEEETKESNDQNVTNPADDHVNQIKQDEKQEAEAKQDGYSSDQDDDIPLSKLKNTEDLDDLPLSMLRTKTSTIKTTTERQKEKHMKTEGNLTKLPHRGRKKRKLENTVSELNKTTKKRKSCQETSAVMNTNFYSGSVRILGKTLVALSESNNIIPESIKDLDTANKGTVSSSPASNDAPFKLKGTKIENIVEKLKAKKVNTEKIENTTALKFQGKIKKKVGRPKGSKNKIKVKHDTEDKASSSTGTSDLMKARRGKPKGEKIKNRTNQIKPYDDSNAEVFFSEKPSVRKDVTTQKSSDASKTPVYVKNKGNSIEENIVEPIKIKKVGRPKGSKTGANKMGCLKKSKSGPGTLKKGKHINAEPKPTGTILTLQSGKVYELKPGNIWDLADRVINTDEGCTKSTQTPIHEKHVDVIQTFIVNPSGKLKSAESLSKKCKNAISVQLKRKLLDKLSRQETPTRVKSEYSDSVLGVTSSIKNADNPPPKRKVGRPKGSKTKIRNKIATSTLNSKAVKKLKSKKQMVSSTKDSLKNNKQKKIKHETINKQTKESITKCSKKKITNLKVTKVKQKYRQQLKNNKIGINKISTKNKTIKNCLKMKSTKGNKKATQILKRKKRVSAVGSEKTKNKQKSNHQIWYIDIERETSDDATTNIPLDQPELTCSVFIHKLPDVKQPLVSTTVGTQDHLSILPIKSEQLVKSEPVLIQFPTHISHVMTTTEINDLSVYREHAEAWGLVKEESYSSNADSSVNDLNAAYDKDQRQVQCNNDIDTQNTEHQTEDESTTVKDIVSFPVLNDVKVLQTCYQKADVEPHIVDSSNNFSDFSTVHKTTVNSECLELSELSNDKNDYLITNIDNSNCDSTNDSSGNVLTLLNHGADNVENNDNSYDHSKSQMANVGSNIPVLTYRNFDIFKTSESHLENSNSDSDIHISSDSTENSNLELYQTASRDITDLIKSKKYTTAMTEIQSNDISKLSQNTHDRTLSDCNRVVENKDFITTKQGGEVDAPKSNSVHVTGSDDNEILPKDRFVVAQLYSQGADKDFTSTLESKTCEKHVINLFQDDVIACSSLESDNEICVVKSALNYSKDDLSYNVVLAESDPEDQPESGAQVEIKY